MIETTVSPLTRKFAALGLALGVLVLAYGIVFEPLARRLIGIAALLEERRDHLGRLEALTRAPAAIAAATGAQRASAAATLIEGDTEAVRLANLQRAVRQLADKAGMRLRSVQTLPTIPRDGLLQLGLQATTQTSLQAAQRLLHALEVHRPILLVDGLELQPVPPQAGENEARDGHLVQLNLRVRGLALDNEKGTGR